jgi:hypothetical protein
MKNPQGSVPLSPTDLRNIESLLILKKYVIMLITYSGINQ